MVCYIWELNVCLNIQDLQMFGLKLNRCYLYHNNQALNLYFSILHTGDTLTDL